MGNVLAVVTDLFFQARITAAARAAGRKVHYVVSGPQLQDAGQYAVALVDLDARTDVLAMIRRLKSDGLAPIVAFGPHLDTERRKQARLLYRSQGRCPTCWCGGGQMRCRSPAMSEERSCLTSGP